VIKKIFNAGTPTGLKKKNGKEAINRSPGNGKEAINRSFGNG